MNLYLNKISRSEVHFGSISDYWAEVLNLQTHQGARADTKIPLLQAQLDAFLAGDNPNEEAVRFVRLYLEACQQYPDAEVTCGS